ncbi:hypothetical protein MVI27_10085 [Chryseobacterium salipaludis]|uniref:hypothetical protein n=1 Tax=Chryseobacterium TaxID=59732 RepID=UPI001FF323C3|nr:MULTISPECIES: hypothetical protein [Chryseobacterium]MCJ8498608.1 hypothetical protein [Chryseobacterium salipaludis]MCX3297742.1 hypothetical protein [Planobacterium sp. JC490]
MAQDSIFYLQGLFRTAVKIIKNLYCAMVVDKFLFLHLLNRKNTAMVILSNVFYLINSFFTTLVTAAEDRSINNFREDFKNPNDRQLINSAVEELRKKKGEKSKTVHLSDRKITIVVK